MKKNILLFLISLISISTFAQMLPKDNGKTYQNAKYLKKKPVTATTVIPVFNGNGEWESILGGDIVEISSGSTLPQNGAVKEGNRFYFRTDSSELTYAGNNKWFVNVVKGSVTPPSKKAIAGQTFDYSRAVWKNPNISIIAGETVDYHYQNNVWIPISPLTPESFGAKEGMNATAAIQKMINDSVDINLRPNTTYLINSKLIIDKNGLNIKGLNSTLKFNPTINSISDVAITRLLDIKTGTKNVFFDGIIFDGANHQPRSALIYADSNSSYTMKNCVVKNIKAVKKGASIWNQCYGVNSSLYGVEFLIDNCKFDSLFSFNNGLANPIAPTSTQTTVTPPFIGGGFIGGVVVFNEGFSSPDAIQIKPTTGTIQNCKFSNIVTIISSQDETHPNNKFDFNDGDAIRTYSNAGVIGAQYAYVKILNNDFVNVSKRAFKIRGMGATVINNRLDVNYNKYVMAAAFDVVSNNYVDKLYIKSDKSENLNLVGYYQVAGEEFNNKVTISNIDCEASENGFLFYSNGFGTPVRNLTLVSLSFKKIKKQGIVHLPTLPKQVGTENISITNCYVEGSVTNGLDSAIALQLDPGLTNPRYNIVNFSCLNSSVKLITGGINVDGMNIRIDNPNYVNYSNSFPIFGTNSNDVTTQGMQNERGTIKNLNLFIEHISGGFLDVSRSFLDVSGNGIDLIDAKLYCNDTIRTTNTFSQFRFLQDSSTVDGFTFDSRGFGILPTGKKVTNLTLSNFYRVGKNKVGTADNFLYGGNILNDGVTINNVFDYRSSTQPTIQLIGGKHKVDNVTSVTTNGDIVGGAGVSYQHNIKNFNSTTNFTIGNFGFNLKTPQYKIDVDAMTQSTGDPLRIKGLNQGNTTDSLMSVGSDGVVKRMTIGLLGGATIIKASNVAVLVPLITGVGAIGFVDVTIAGLLPNAGQTIQATARTNMAAAGISVSSCFIISANTVRLIFSGLTPGDNGNLSVNMDFNVIK